MGDIIFLKKWTFWAVIIWIALLIIITYVYWNGYSTGNIIIKIPIILTDKEYISLLFWLLGFSFWMYKFFYVLELKDKYKKHLNYISNILQQNNIAIEWGIFNSFEEAEEKYKKYKEWYIFPYGYKYSILDWNINDYSFDSISNIDEFDDFVLQNDNKIYREFVDLYDFKKNILLEENNNKKIKISHNWYHKILKEYFVLEDSGIYDIKKWLKENGSIVIVKWYLFIKFLKNA